MLSKTSRSIYQTVLPRILFNMAFIPFDAVSSAATVLPKNEFYDAEIGIANAAWGRIAAFGRVFHFVGKGNSSCPSVAAWNDYGSKEIWFW